MVKTANRFSGRAGFTLIELVVVMSVIALMSVAIYANYSAIDNRGKILGVAGKIKTDLNVAQDYSLTGHINQKNRPDGWGVYFNRNLNKYIVFSDLNRNGQYDYPIKLLIHGSETVSGGVFTDSSQLASTIAVTGATQVLAAGQPPDDIGYWSFDGASDSLRVPTNSAFDPGSDSWAIDFWFKASSTGSQKALAYKGNGSGTLTFGIYKDANDKINGVVYDDLGTAYTVQSRGAISLDTWYHVALVRDNSLNVVILFIDGLGQTKKRITRPVRSQSVSIYIGAEDNGSSNSWNGAIDEIRFSRGTGRWIERFTRPTSFYKNDDEAFREVKLPPGLVLERLYSDSVGVDELNIFFSPTNYMMYANGAVPTTYAEIKLNNAGAENTGSSADILKSIKVLPSGSTQWGN